MAGNLVISQINGGQIGYRNIIINGGVNTNRTINQRSKLFNDVSNGEYFADRWKRTSSSTMTQIVAGGNFIPGVEYCLSGDGVTTQVLFSPTSGNWTLPNIPSTASNIQLEMGTEPTLFELRPRQYEKILCMAYYYKGNITQRVIGWGNTGLSGALYYKITFPIPMRIAPTTNIIASNGINYNSNPVVITRDFVSKEGSANSSGFMSCTYTFTEADAEL